ncbi:unknown [Akkermansia sp. CAG:344]|nr:unknown [Akkermansia sp. CAG:344]
MHSRIWTIAVSNYMKKAVKAIQIQRFPEERAIRTRRTARARVMPSGEIDGQAAV